MVEKFPICEALIFLVGLAHKKGSRKDLEKHRLINLETLKDLIINLEKKKKLPKKIIFASTISVYGEKLNENTYNEDFVLNPKSPYAISKMEAETFLIKNYSSKSWILRLAPVYSADFNLNIYRRTKLFGFFYKIGDGGSKLSLCNLGNIKSVIKEILEDKVPKGVYNISDKKQYSYNDLLNYVGAKNFIKVPKIILKILLFLEG